MEIEKKEKKKGKERERKLQSVSSIGLLFSDVLYTFLRIYASTVQQSKSVVLSDDARAELRESLLKVGGGLFQVAQPWDGPGIILATPVPGSRNKLLVSLLSTRIPCWTSRRRPETNRPMETRSGDAHMNMVQCRPSIAPYTV